MTSIKNIKVSNISHYIYAYFVIVSGTIFSSVMLVLISILIEKYDQIISIISLSPNTKDFLPLNFKKGSDIRAYSFKSVEKAESIPLFVYYITIRAYCFKSVEKSRIDSAFYVIDRGLL